MDTAHNGGRSLTEEDRDQSEGRSEWLSWPPTPKMQIVLMVLVLGLINLILVGVWAIVLFTR